MPCVVKPVMSSSGKGQSTVKHEAKSMRLGLMRNRRRAGQGRVIVEGFIRFDYEITLLTVRTRRHRFLRSDRAPADRR